MLPTLQSSVARDPLQEHGDALPPRRLLKMSDRVSKDCAQIAFQKTARGFFLLI